MVLTFTRAFHHQWKCQQGQKDNATALYEPSLEDPDSLEVSWGPCWFADHVLRTTGFLLGVPMLIFAINDY